MLVALAGVVVEPADRHRGDVVLAAAEELERVHPRRRAAPVPLHDQRSRPGVPGGRREVEQVAAELAPHAEAERRERDEVRLRVRRRHDVGGRHRRAAGEARIRDGSRDGVWTTGPADGTGPAGSPTSIRSTPRPPSRWRRTRRRNVAARPEGRIPSQAAVAGRIRSRTVYRPGRRPTPAMGLRSIGTP